MATPATEAQLQGEWCFREIEGFGQTLEEKVEIQLLKDGRYTWTEGSFQQQGQWRLSDGSLHMTDVGAHEVLSLSEGQLYLRRMGSRMRWSRGSCPPGLFSTQDRIAFHNAASTGDLATVEQWLDRGLSPDARDHSRGDTGLVKAAKFCRPVVAQRLLARGADAQIANDEGMRALDYARQSRFHQGCKDIVRLLPP